jgi:hypothetical protein
MSISSIQFMAIELTRLGVGILILLFHRQIADYILEQERAIVGLFRQRGLSLPCPSTEGARTIYFCMGAFVALYECGRIWLQLHP